MRCIHWIPCCWQFHLWFLKCFSYQHGVLPALPQTIHDRLGVKHGGALACLSTWVKSTPPHPPPRYFLISCMPPPPLLFHHMVISCSPLKWGMWMLICQLLRPNEGPKAISSPPAVQAVPSPRPRITFIPLALDPSSFVTRSICIFERLKIAKAANDPGR